MDKPQSLGSAEFVTLGDVTTEQINRSGPGNSEFVYVDISSVDRESKLISDAKTLLANAAPSRARQRLNTGDVLVSMTRPNLNAVALVTVEYDGAIGSTGFHVLRAKQTEPKFLFYLVQTREFIQSMCACVQGALYPAVRPKDIEAFGFYLPPLREQRRIVAKIEELFSELDKGIESLKTAQAQLEVYRQALLKHAFEGKLTAQWRADNPDKLEAADALLKRIQKEREQRYQQQVAEWEAAGKPGSKPKVPKQSPLLSSEEIAELPDLPEKWVWVRLASVVTVLSGYAFKSADFVSNGIPVIKIANIGYSEFVDKDQEYLDYPFVKTHEDFVVSPDDFLIALTRPITNNRTKVCRYPKNSPPALLNQRVAALKDSALTPDFLYAFFGSSIFKELIRSKFSETLQPNLSPKDLEACPVPVCALAEQSQISREIETRLSEVDQLEKTISDALQQADALRQSILKKAFSGQLVPQDPADEPASALLARIKAEQSAAPKAKKARK